uniref:Uncharacterized protein n=1 Tax=Trametes cubensis TaxID=1111947 RepID=A0AAD7THD8_9APHY
MLDTTSAFNVAPSFNAALLVDIPLSTPVMSKQQYHQRQRSKRRRNAARAKRALDVAHGACYSYIKQVARKWRARATPLDVDFEADVDDAPSPLRSALLPLAANAYIATNALQDDVVRRRTATKEQLVALGYEYVAWDGRTPRLLVDGEGLVIGVLAGRPSEAT